MASQEEITQLLEAYAGGSRDALDELFPLVYDELRQIARGRLRGERSDHTLGATALVHEAYLKLVNLDRMNWQNRAHFFAISAQAMRNILVDYAIRRKAQKRGGGQVPVSLDDAPGDALMSEQGIEEMLVLNDALERLAALDPRQAKVVECRFFGGLSIEETAHVLDVSPATVSRDWSMARAWLNRELGEGRIEESP
jgi:RNA polymerase sigma factor (TIGR02999 family)